MLLGNRELTQEEFKAFAEALIKAFNLGTFDTMLLNAFGWQYTAKTSADGFENIVPRIILWVQQDNKTHELLMAALTAHPENQHLLAFARKFGITFPTTSPTLGTLPALLPSQPIQPPVDPLERKIRELDSDLDPAQFRMCLERLEKQICKISIKVGRREISGTAFLLYTDIIITNYHVVRDVIDGPILPDSVTLFFDYKLEADGKKVDMGTPYKLAKDWLIDYSPNNDADFQITEHTSDVEEKYLDYALLRLAKKVGDERLKGNLRRGWIHLPETEYEFKQDSSIFILHHPDGDPLKLAMNTQSVLEVNTNKTRVRYSTSTEYGSSGAPCFNSNWELVAIHQSGDPDFSRDAKYNQGIPIATILRRLQKFGKKGLLSSKKNGNERKQNVSYPDLPRIQFELPEGEMSHDAKVLLDTFVQRIDPTSFPSSQPDWPESQQPLKLAEKQLDRIVGKLNSEQLFLLLISYLHVEYVIAERAQKLFAIQADIQPADIKSAINALYVIEDCLRKVCVLLNNGSHLLKKISLEKVSQFTVEADTMIEKISAFRHYLVEEKDKFPYNAKICSNVREKFAEILSNLDMFQRKFNGKDD